MSVPFSPRIMGAQGSGRDRNFRPLRALLCRQAEPAPFRGRRAGDPKRPWPQGRIAAFVRRSATSAREPVSSPRRQNGRRETCVVDSRPSDLDPYPRFGRAPGAAEVWDQSLARSQQRRRLERVSRSHRQRRKGTSLAVGAAMLAAPVVPAFAGSSSGRGGGAGARPHGALDTSSVALATGGRTQLLQFGDVGPAVAAVQARVGTAADGIFRPPTRAPVAPSRRPPRAPARG